MMKKIVLLLILVFCASSCEKFEDGGFHYASARNIIGTWNYNCVEINDVQVDDSTFYALYRNSTIQFEKGTTVVYTWKNASDSILEQRDGSYVFNYNKKKMSIVFGAYPLDEWVYDVKKLTKDEFWVEYSANDSVRMSIQLLKSKEK